MTLDPQRVYDKLEALAVRQATIIQSQKDDRAQNKEEHGEINTHLQASNGDMQELRREFNEGKVAQKIDQAANEAVEKTLKRGVAFILAAIALASTVVPIVFIIESRIGS